MWEALNFLCTVLMGLDGEGIWGFSDQSMTENKPKSKRKRKPQILQCLLYLIRAQRRYYWDQNRGDGPLGRRAIRKSRVNAGVD